MPRVRLPDGQILNFPEGTPQAEMSAAIQRNFPEFAPQQPTQQQQPSQQVPVQQRAQVLVGMDTGIHQAYDAGKLTDRKKQAYEELLKRAQTESTPELDRFLAQRERSKVSERMPVYERQMGVAAIDPEQALDVMGGGERGFQRTEAAMTIGSAAVAEPVSGFAGIAGGLLPGEEGQAAEWVKGTREALTYKPTKAGMEKLQEVAEVIEPVGKAIQNLEQGLGEFVYSKTDSPALAAAATTIPTLVTEALGIVLGKTVASASRKVKQLKSQGKIAREIKKAAPEVQALKDAARDLYDEIDNAGAIVKKGAYKNLSQLIKRQTKKAGLDPDISPKAAKAVRRLEELEGQQVTITELDTLRKVAQGAANSIEPVEKALGARIINSIDDFLEKVGPEQLDIPNNADMLNISKKYKAARNLWGRARKSELLGEAFSKARIQASGFENGLRIQFRSILNNKKTRKFFNEKELAEMKRVVEGGKVENAAKLVGRLGFSEGGATNIVGSLLGAGGGAYVAGPGGAIFVPLIGQVSRKLAQRMTRGSAEFADAVIRAGNNAKEITKAYLKNTPRSQRTPNELSQLLLEKDIDITKLPDTPLNRSAAEMVRIKRETIDAAIAAGTIQTAKNLDEIVMEEAEEAEAELGMNDDID